MRGPHLLLAGRNPRRIKENLVGIVDAAAIRAIEGEIQNNVRQLFALGEQHFSFALALNNGQWRQKVSRLYYGAYNVSRAIRLLVWSEYSTDVKDHKKVEELPDDFPSKDIIRARLAALREDRNLCDYDHTATEDHLVLGVGESVEFVTTFVEDAKKYLISRGIALEEESQ